MLASCPLSTSIFRMKKKKITETSVFFSHRLFSFASSACYMHQNGLGPDCSLQPVPTQAKKKLVLWLECSAAFSSCECGVSIPARKPGKAAAPVLIPGVCPKDQSLGSCFSWPSSRICQMASSQILDCTLMTACCTTLSRNSMIHVCYKQIYLKSRLVCAMSGEFEHC